MKLHLNESLFESWWDDEISSFKEPETVSELIGSKVVYHATYKPYWEEIKKEGFIKPGKHQNWGDAFKTKYNIYLSKDYYNALSYAETAEEVPEELLNQIVVLEIDADKLNIDHLDPDNNQVYDYDGEIQLEDPLTWVELQYDLPIPVSAVKKVHDESELDEGVEHHQMTYYNAKAALQNYILKYGRIDGPFELYYNFRLTPSEIKDILSYALDNKMIDEYQKDQILNNLGIKED